MTAVEMWRTWGASEADIERWTVPADALMPLTAHEIVSLQVRLARWIRHHLDVPGGDRDRDWTMELDQITAIYDRVLRWSETDGTTPRFLGENLDQHVQPDDPDNDGIEPVVGESVQPFGVVAADLDESVLGHDGTLRLRGGSEARSVVAPAATTDQSAERAS